MHCSILQRYHTEGAKIEEVDGFAMVTKMAANVEVMMQHKIESIKVWTMNYFNSILAWTLKILET